MKEGLLLFAMLLAPWDALALWPLPLSATNGSSAVQVVPASGEAFFTMSDGAEACSTLSEAFARYTKLMFPHPSNSAPAGKHGTPLQAKARDSALTSIVVSVASQDESFPALETDESYTLDIPGDASDASATLSASTVYGALRGLETLSQLVSFDFDTRAYEISGAPWAIKDAPRFQHRGLMVDTARHFLPLATLRRAVDSMAYAKLNVLHWHMVDTQSFPFEVAAAPELWTEGAFSAGERYLQEDVSALVEYARARGIRVVVEFDVPGHAASWCKGRPDVCPASPTCLEPLNVATNATFDLIGTILDEAVGPEVESKTARVAHMDSAEGIFPDAMVHLGGDEVDTTCWEQDPDISAWLAAQGMTADDGYAYFVNRAAQMAIARGKRPVQWSEVYDHFKTELAKETVVHIWKRVTNVTEVVANGYDVLVNVGYVPRSWYLDNTDVAWKQCYEKDPCEGVLESTDPSLCEAHVLGGHGEMWGEHVDGSDLEATVWPRLAAIAERLWSPLAATGAEGATAAALPRLEVFRCEVLLDRGIAAAPVRNQRARTAPHGPGSCYAQRRRRQRQLK